MQPKKSKKISASYIQFLSVLKQKNYDNFNSISRLTRLNVGYCEKNKKIVL